MISILKLRTEYELIHTLSTRTKLRLWLLSHPELNFYKFSINNSFRILTSYFRQTPDFIIIGSTKSGTTSLSGYLRQHPNLSIITNVHFFEYILTNNLRWYKSHFPTNLQRYYVKLKTGQNHVAGEDTATYLFHSLVPERIKKTIPHVKLIIILRNPVDRAYSNYQHQVREGLEIKTFEDAIKSELKRMGLIEDNKKIKINNSDFDNATIFSYLRHGIYVDRIKIWMTLFGKNQFLILNTEELAENTDKTLNKIFEFLDVPHYKIPDLRRRNVGKYEKMQESTREFLINFYKPHNQRLYKFLNRRFDWDK